VALPFGFVSTCQETTVLLAPVTIAVKVCVCHLVMAARFGLIVTAVVPGLVVTVMAAGAVLAGSVTEAAVKVTAGFAGTPGGPVYLTATPEALVLGESVPQLGEQFVPDCVSIHWAPAFATSFCTVAVKN
jgi:hypothetical protein